MGCEIGIEDRHELGIRQGEAPGQRAGLEALPDVTSHMQDIHAFAMQALDQRCDKRGGCIGRIVEDLNLQPVARVVQCAYRRDDISRDCPFVEDRYLDQHLWNGQARTFRPRPRRFRGATAPH